MVFLLQIKSHVMNLKTDMVTQLCYCAANGDISAMKTMLNHDTDHDINEYEHLLSLHAQTCPSINPQASRKTLNLNPKRNGRMHGTCA